MPHAAPPSAGYRDAGCRGARRRIAAGGLAALLVAALLTAAGLVTAPPADANGGAFVSLINSARASAGLPALSSRGDLAAVAARWTQQMASSGELAHNPDLASQVSGYRFVGENVGYGPDAATVHRAFMDSPGHRANILDRDYTEVGVAVVQVGERLWVTEVFRAPAGSGAAAEPKEGSDGQAKPSAGRSSGRSSTDGAAPARSGAPRSSTGKPSSAPQPPPSPQELLRRRAQAALEGPGAQPASDPVQQALRFAEVMRAVHG